MIHLPAFGLRARMACRCTSRRARGPDGGVACILRRVLLIFARLVLRHRFSSITLESHKLYTRSFRLSMDPEGGMEMTNTAWERQDKRRRRAADRTVRIRSRAPTPV